MIAYSDVDWTQEAPDWNAMSGFISHFARAAVSSRSKKQSIVPQSTVETEHIAVSFAFLEYLWFRMHGSELDIIIGSF